jgi:hypothetical protein
MSSPISQFEISRIEIQHPGHPSGDPRLWIPALLANSNCSLFSSVYICQASMIWRLFETQRTPEARAFPLIKTGNNRLARMAITLMTTNNSIKVNALLAARTNRAVTHRGILSSDGREGVVSCGSAKYLD